MGFNVAITVFMDVIHIGVFFFLSPLLSVLRMKEVKVGEKKVLLVRSQDQYSAVGSQCSHYNAPLAKGKPSVV